MTPNNSNITITTPFNTDTTILYYSDTNCESNVAQNTAIKFDSNKPDWSLLPVQSVEEIIKVLQFGAKKYAAWNFANGEGLSYSRVLNSLLRHIFAFMRGENIDPETGLSHIAHAGCNVLFLLHYILHKDRYPNNDDRPKQ